MPVEIDKILTNTRTFLLLLAMGGSGLYFIFNNWNKFELLQVQQEQVLMRLDNFGEVGEVGEPGQGYSRFKQGTRRL